jgi:hypothetical protein
VVWRALVAIMFMYPGIGKEFAEPYDINTPGNYKFRGRWRMDAMATKNQLLSILLVQTVQYE